jgi:hypothetical protein
MREPSHDSEVAKAKRKLTCVITITVELPQRTLMSTVNRKRRISADASLPYGRMVGNVHRAISKRQARRSSGGG